MTKADLARTAAWIAKSAANWSGEFLCNPEEINEPLNPDTTERFISDIEEKLDLLRRGAAL